MSIAVSVDDSGLDAAPYVGVFDLFKLGIGPSSSHTSGPMLAAAKFIRGRSAQDACRIKVTLFGSLAWTGKGHSTDTAVTLGLAGWMPDSVDPDRVPELVAEIRTKRALSHGNGERISFNPDSDIVFDTQTPSLGHPNSLRFEAFDQSGALLGKETWFSVGGGFVVREGEEEEAKDESLCIPFPFSSASELLALGRAHGLSIPEIVRGNEVALRPAGDVAARIAVVARAMFACVERGLASTGRLPGPLNVRRRAQGIFAQARASQRHNDTTWVPLGEISAFAIAVNEENACGGRVVTAPTNGAAGVIPSVLRYYKDFCPSSTSEGIETFFLAATAVGSLVKRRASISGAEVGCQGEVGTAAAMAAAGLCAARGGTNEQIENAAEIALEHHLGMTCDPVAGLVQIPCIERNAFGAVKAVNAASLALYGDGTHRVSLDQVIETMRQTGADMKSKYKETSLGGLAANVPAC